MSVDSERIWSREALLKLLDESEKQGKYIKLAVDRFRELIPEYDMWYVELVIEVALQQYYLYYPDGK